MATIDGISTLEIKVVTFRPIGSVTTTTVEMALQNSVSVLTSEGAPSGVFTDDLVTLVGSYFIKVKRWTGTGTPAAPNQAVKLRFFVTTHPTNPDQNDQYLLQGIAFSNRDQTAPMKPSDDNRLGQLHFTSINIEQVNGQRMFTVTNNRPLDKRISYDYLFLIQRTRDGAIGIIDPEYENE